MANQAGRGIIRAAVKNRFCWSVMQRLSSNLGVHTNNRLLVFIYSCWTGCISCVSSEYVSGQKDKRVTYNGDESEEDYPSASGTSFLLLYNSFQVFSNVDTHSLKILEVKWIND